MVLCTLGMRTTEPCHRLVSSEVSTEATGANNKIPLEVHKDICCQNPLGAYLTLATMMQLTDARTTATRRSCRRQATAAAALLVAGTLVSTPFKQCSSFLLHQPRTHDSNVQYYRRTRTLRPSLTPVLRAQRPKVDDGSSSSTEDAPFPPFGIPSLDLLIAPLTPAVKKGPSDTSTNNKLPFGFNVENTAALEQIILDSVAPVEKALDALTGDWALSYADLRPDTPNTLAGQAFLATNSAYLVAGLFVLFSGDLWFGFWTDMAAIASFNYHYNQLLVSGQAKANSVRLALLLDYTAAAFSIITATAYLLASATFPVFPFAVSIAGFFFLFLSWQWEYGRPYMFWHSLWHLCSAYSGFLIGTLHSTQ